MTPSPSTTMVVGANASFPSVPGRESKSPSEFARSFCESARIVRLGKVLWVDAVASVSASAMEMTVSPARRKSSACSSSWPSSMRQYSHQWRKNTITVGPPLFRSSRENGDPSARDRLKGCSRTPTFAGPSYWVVRSIRG